MKHEEQKQAFKEVLMDESFINKFADVAIKKMMEQKLKTNNYEEQLIAKHVVFASNEENGSFFTASEMVSKLHDIVGVEEEISARRLGKALLKFAHEAKQASNGRVYLVAAVLKDIRYYVPVEKATEEEIKEVENLVPDQKEEQEIKKKKKSKKSNSDKDINEEEVTEIEVIDEEEIDSDDLKHSAFSVRMKDEVPINKLIITNEVAELISNEFETLEDYKEHLEGLKFKKLVKHSKKNGYDLDFEELEKDEIIHDIIDCFENEYSDLFETTDVLDEQDLKDLKPEKKKKKDKKKKKKNKDQ